MHERLSSPELAPELVRAFAETFITRWDCYPLQLSNGTYTRVQDALALTHIHRHLTNFRFGYQPLTVGAYALNTDNEAKWVCFDADRPEHWEQLRQLSQSLSAQSIPSYLELSRRGGHLWLFTPKLSGRHARQFARTLLALYQGANTSPPVSTPIEIYPKQDKLGEGTGSFVRLPLGLHRKTGRVYPFVTLDGSPLAPTIRAQLDILGHPQQISLDYIQAILATEIPAIAPIAPPPRKIAKHSPRGQEPLSESLKRAISVFDFITRYVAVDAHGRGLCPFHNDTHQSFQVNIEKNYWNCYAGCGGGSIIDFWVKWRRQQGQDASFAETVKELRGMLLQ